MGLLSGQKGVIFGIANKFSIAYAVAEKFRAEGAEIAVNFLNPRLAKSVVPLAEGIGAKIIKECDVNNDEMIDDFFKAVKDEFGQIDFLIHAVAFADKNDLEGKFVDTSRQGFLMALEVSAFSFVALTKAASSILKDGASVMTMTYNGSNRVIPNYNVMGVAKAALESATRYLANDMGERNIRVNSVSPGPFKTLSSSGISQFKKLLHHAEDTAPLRRNVTLDEVSKVCTYLASDLSTGVTGQNIFVDGGFQIMGLTGKEANRNG